MTIEELRRVFDEYKQEWVEVGCPLSKLEDGMFLRFFDYVERKQATEKAG